MPKYRSSQLREKIKKQLSLNTTLRNEDFIKTQMRSRYVLLRRREPLKSIEEIKNMVEKEFPIRFEEFSRRGWGGDRRSGKALKSKVHKS